MQLISRRWSDWLWGISWALGFAVVFSAWAALASRGRLDEVIPKYNQSPLQIIGTYFAIAAVIGPVLGLFRPALRYRLGAFVVGAIVGTTVYSGVGLAQGMFDRVYFMIVAVIGTISGGGLGVVFYDKEHRTARPPDEEL